MGKAVCYFLPQLAGFCRQCSSFMAAQGQLVVYHPEIIGVSGAATGNAGLNLSPPCLAGSSEKCDLLQQQRFRSNPFCNPLTSGNFRIKWMGSWLDLNLGNCSREQQVPAGWTLQGCGSSSCRVTPGHGSSLQAPGGRRMDVNLPSLLPRCGWRTGPARATFHEESQDVVNPRTNCPQMAH